ncbi:hypothetical protein O181_037083 [Austropuccinia psidii MF-1]|uniref:Uncharacterized protein n=1 Tax=Austropuccinia psidii MF-1 TaxID=1389203 RepID=A0A9Q3DAQ0_9BASI|nr:hypothetical protein [Austropuccinia psidii MF-1]
MASGNPHRPPAQFKGKISQSSIHPVLKDAGVVLIGYYIPLCTIFAQQCNGDAFRSQNTSPTLNEDSSAHQSCNPWPLSEGHPRTPTTWFCRRWVGNSVRIIPRAIPRGYSSFNKFSRQKVLQYSLESSIHPYRQQSIVPVCPWDNSYSTVGIQSHSSICKMARTVLTQFRQYSWMIHLPGSASPFSHILATFHHLGTFSPVN